MENPDDKPVDYTQVLYFPHLLRNVLKFLPDDTAVDDLDNLVWVDREFQDEVSTERRRRIKYFLTYGAAAVREGHETDKRVLTSILGDQDNWKTSKYAMILVARTFSGAKHDPNGPYRFENLYPELPQSGPNSESKPAFRKVLQWWQWMCTNNKAIAIKTDLLSFFLFAGENWKRHNQTQKDLDVDTVDQLSINGVGVEIKAVAFFKHSSLCVKATKDFALDDVDLELFFSPDTVQFTFTRQYEWRDTVHDEFNEYDGLNDKFRIDRNETALWAHACVDVLIAKATMRSLLKTRRFLEYSHIDFCRVISRQCDQDEFASRNNDFMF